MADDAPEPWIGKLGDVPSGADLSDYKYDPSQSIIFKNLPDSNTLLFAYLISGSLLIILASYIMYGTILPTNKGGKSDYDLYMEKSTFPSQSVVFFGSVISIVVLSLVCYRVNTRTASILFMLSLLLLSFWYFNLLLRVEMVADGSDHQDNGGIYLTIIVFLLIGITYLSFKKDTGLGMLSLIPTIFYIFILWKWLFDGYIP